MNITDLIISIGCLISIILRYTLKGNVNTGYINSLRFLRVGRIFKLFKSFKSINTVFESFYYTLPGLINVGGLLVLLIYIYSVLAMNVFAPLKLSDLMNDDINF